MRRSWFGSWFSEPPAPPAPKEPTSDEVLVAEAMEAFHALRLKIKAAQEAGLSVSIGSDFYADKKAWGGSGWRIYFHRFQSYP